MSARQPVARRQVMQVMRTMGKSTIAVVTGSTLPEPDLDEPLLLAALSARGIDAHAVAWDDPAVDWGGFDLAVVRSTWNYVQRRADFCAWADDTSRQTRLLNPPAILRWNTDKRYLGQLAAQGVPVVPTEWVDRGARLELTTLARARGWHDVVIKPCVSAGSFATQRFELRAGGRDTTQEAQAFLDHHRAERGMMVQPYQGSVESSGERAVVWIDGQLTHAVRKSPRFAGGDEHVSGALPIAADERRLAERLLEPLAADLLYARVDLARDPTGAPCVMELELTEPSLFLAQHPPALERLASAMARRVEATAESARPAG